MRKEVKRSLIFWPAIVSATIILMSLLTATNNAYLTSLTDRARIVWGSFTGTDQLNPQLAESEPWQPPVSIATSDMDFAPPIDLESVAVITPAESELAERMERGSRAMRVPDRVADVFGSSNLSLRESQQNIDASKVIQPARNFGNNVSVLSSDMFKGDILAAERIASETKIGADRAIGINTLQVPSTSLPEDTATPSPSDTAKTSETALISPSGPMNHAWIDSQFFEDPIVKIELPAVDSPAMLDSLVVSEAIPQPTTERPTVMPQSIKNLAKVIERKEEPVAVEINVRAVENATAKATENAVRNKVHAGPAAWPVTQRLNDQLIELAGAPSTTNDTQFVSATTPDTRAANWSAEITTALSELQSLPRLGDPRAGELLQTLATYANKGYGEAENVSNRKQQIDWLLTCHAINRRLAVWKPIYQIVSGNGNSYVSDSHQKIDPVEMRAVIAQVRSDLAETGDAAGWERYLMLAEMESAMQGEHVDQRSMLAQRLLSRLQWHGLSVSSKEWLQRESIQELRRLIQPWARNAVDYASLLSQIERHEADAIDLAALDIAGAAQTLRFAENPKAVEVADAIDAYYRNANVRMAISEELLQRMVPEVTPQTVPVRTNVLGSRVGGYSHINSRLNLDLQESRDRWSLTINTNGNVHTQSTGRTDLTAISTNRDSNFAAATPIQITPLGTLVGNSAIDVRGSTRLNRVNTRYDGWPLFGTLVRSIVTSHYEESSGLTARIANRKLKTQLGSEIDTRLNEKIAKASETMTRVVMGPLSGLKLDPKVIDMKTTEDRLIARYRLAGDWQIGASTPRPRAPSNSLISLQVNQTALNNVLERIAPLDSPTTIDAAVQNTMRLFGQSETALPDDIPRDVSVQFAKTRPITVEIEEGKVWITMRVVELSREKGPKLKRFIVRAAYLPQVDGLNASLVRDGHLRISGPGMSMRQRLPVRAIFNKVLAPSRSIPLTTPEMANSPALQNAAITQLELRDGWLALAIANRQSDRVAKQPELEPLSR